MLFNVKVVSQAEYDAHIAELKSHGQTGLLDNTLNREPVLTADQELVPSATEELVMAAATTTPSGSTLDVLHR